MDFVLQNDNAYNTILGYPDGTHAYQFQTAKHFVLMKDTIVSKYMSDSKPDSGASWQPIAKIKPRAFNTDALYFKEDPLSIKVELYMYVC